MKKLQRILWIALLTVSLSACGSNDTGKESAKEQNPPTETATPTPTPEPVLQEQSFLPTEDYVRTIGRTMTAKDSLWLVHSGTGCEFSFNGTKATVKLKPDSSFMTRSNQARVAIYVNGERVVDDMVDKMEKVMDNKNYRKRVIDDLIKTYLSVSGAICVEGPKWCGKTWTSLNHANSVAYMTENRVKNLAMVDPKYIFTPERPQLIDEWQVVPEIWDAVRHECDEDHDKGKFILTGSTTLMKQKGEKKVHHTGTGRIAPLKMYPMSLFESGESTGEASLADMLNGKVCEGYVRKVELDELARLIIRGGWPENIDMPAEDIGIIPESYIEAIVTKDMHERQTKKRSPQKMRMLIRALSRHESSIAGNKTLVKDIEEYENGDELIESRGTVADYESVLHSLFLISNQEAYSIHYRSSTRIGKSAKRHLVDPSLSCARMRTNRSTPPKEPPLPICVLRSRKRSSFSPVSG